MRTGSGAGASATAAHKSVLRFNVPADQPDKWSIELTNIDPYTPPADGVIAVYAVPADGRAVAARRISTDCRR